MAAPPWCSKRYERAPELVLVITTQPCSLSDVSQIEKLPIGTDGFALLTDVLAKVKATREEVLSVVENNDKQRFSIITREGKEYIRANQGHTIDVPDLELKRIKSVEDIPKPEHMHEARVVHGTYIKAWKLIRKGGLSRMERNHIHFAIGTPGETHVISGMRSSAQVLIYIDMAKALADGLEFFISANNVVLSPGNREGAIPPEYFRAVLDAESEKPFDEDFPLPL